MTVTSERNSAAVIRAEAAKLFFDRGYDATTLRQVAAGKLDLDRDVNSYLKSWRIPAAPAFNSNHVTLRMLMSHTSG